MTRLVDGWDLRSVDTAFREAWTEWFERHRQRFQMRLLVRSELIDMAASLANLFTGVKVIETYSSVEAWERDCRQDVPNFQRAAPPAGCSGHDTPDAINPSRPPAHALSRRSASHTSRPALRRFT